MRICFISRRYFPAISGMSVYARNLLHELVARGHDVVMISQYRNDPAGTGVYGGGPPPAVPGVAVTGLESLGEQRVNHDLPADFESDIEAMVEAALAHHRHEPFDLVHAQYGYPNGLAALEVSRRTGIPNVVSIQGGDGHWVGSCCRTHAAAMQAVLGYAGDLIIGSESFAGEVIGHHGVDRSRFTVIPGAVDARRFRPAGAWTPGRLRQTPVLLYHGRVDRRKGVLELLDAVAMLREADVALKLLVSGIGPDLAAARDRAADLGLGDVIDFLGYVDYAEVPGVYRRADVFVSPTWSEGVYNTVLEAMASGLPIVAARAVGVVDCLVHEHNALLHDVHDVPGLAAAIERMLGRSDERSALARRAMRQIQDTYQWPVIARAIEARYEAVRHRRPDDGWTAVYDPLTRVGDADPSCRFRRQPHLL